MEALFGIHPATNGGTGPWASSLMVAIRNHSNHLSTEEILLAFKCLQALSGNSYISLPAVDFWISIVLEFRQDPDIVREGFNTLNNLVSKFQNVSELFDNGNLKAVLKCGITSNVLSDDEAFKCQSILKYGTNGIQIEEKNTYLFLPTMLKILKAKA